jgi:hypothetical protein
MSVRFVDSRLDFGEAELLVRKGIEENSVVFEKGQRTVTLKLKDGFNERICAAALRRLAVPSQRRTVYWTSGHGECRFDAYDQWGMSDIARELTHEGYNNKEIDLSDSRGVPADCALIVVAGANRDFSRVESGRLNSYLKQGGRMLVLLNSHDAGGVTRMLPTWGVNPMLRAPGTVRTLTGTDVTAALVVLQGMGVDAFGLNCSTGPDKMLPQLQRLKEYAAIPLIAKPNAGVPQVVDGKTVYNCTPEQFTAYVEEMATCGVCIFGGCCGTDVEHMEALVKATAGLDPKVCTPAHPDKLPCATGKQPFLLDVTAAYGNVLPCDEDLEDALFDEMEEDAELIAIRFESEEELDTFSDCQGMIGKPLCVLCEDADLLEQVLRRYQGRAVYEGSLPDEVLMPLVSKYGLLL